MTTLPTHERTPGIMPTGAMPPPTIHKPSRAVAGRAGMSGQDAMRIIRKHVLLIIISLIMFSGASVGGTWLWLRYAPTFTSTVYLGVDPPRVNPLQFASRNIAADLDIKKQSVVNLAKTEEVLGWAIEFDKDQDENVRTRIKDTDFYTGNLKETVDLLQRELSVSAIRDTYLIRISLSGPTPEELPEVVNAVADAVVYREIERNKLKSAQRMKSLNVRLSETVGEIKAKQKLIEQIRGQSEVPLMREERNITQINLQALTSELTNLGLLRAQAEGAMEALEEQNRNKTLGESTEVQQALEQDPTYRSMVVTTKNLKIELDSLLDRLLPGHRRVKATQARLDTVKKERDELKIELVETQVKTMLQQQGAQVSAIRERLMAVRNQYNEKSASLRDLGKKLNQISVLEAEIERLQARATLLETALLQLRVTLGDLPISLETIGGIPISPSWPSYPIMIPLGVFLGLAFGLGLAFLIELMDTSIKSPRDISARIDIPLLGMIPHQDDMDEEIPDMRTLMLTSSDSLGGEAYRQIRTCLLFSGPANQRRSLMITSPSPGDGRTAVTLNLATSIAQGGRKVLVVDANFRQPSISTLFPKASPNGLSSALVGQGRWEDNVYEVDGNLSVMTSGPLPPNPAELLGSEQMKTIIGEMTAKYDQVLFDGAPALVVTDPSVLASQVDGVIIVIRAGISTHGILQRTQDIFLRVGAHVVGAVLNGVRTTAGGYLKRNYNTFYEYRGQQLASPAMARKTPQKPFPLEPTTPKEIQAPNEPVSSEDSDLS
jgi:polysaccharide biosynthesis transport protein